MNRMIQLTMNRTELTKIILNMMRKLVLVDASSVNPGDLSWQALGSSSRLFFLCSDEHRREIDARSGV